ncbi:hypothetical protein MC885_019318 [Smutsia gigantea]|nr:hypothetical protein MC885_019318 [Smutsia gigantea]
MEFSVSSLSIQEPSRGTTGQMRCKASQGAQTLRASQGGKSSSLDALGPARKEEEASFWKVNAERSRGEGPEAEFPSLTPSQIKSMEKGEKVLPACYWQDPTLKDRVAAAEGPGIFHQGQCGLPSTGTEHEKPQPSQACNSTSGDATPSKPAGEPPPPEAGQAEEDALFSEAMPAQVGGTFPSE